MLLHGPASTVIHSLKSHDPHKILKSASTVCPGYALVFPEGQNHFGLYLFGLHATCTLPWSFVITNDAMRLHSDSCTHSPQYHKDSTVPLPCSWCHVLYNHTIIMGICHQALDGTHENTPWQYLSFVELGQVLWCKNHHLKQLNFNGLNMGRALMVCNCTIDGYKQLAIAISVCDITWIHSLFRTELRNGAGVFRLLDKTSKAAKLAYSPKGYEEADYHCAFLLWKLGGHSAANIGYCTLGVPSIDMAQRHVSTTPLVTSAGMPTIAEINANLAIGFKHQEYYRD